MPKITDPPEFQEFADLLRSIMGNRTQEWLAEKIGVTRPYITKLLKGKYSPSARIAGQIAAIFDIEPGEMARRTKHSEDAVDEAFNLFNAPNLEEDNISSLLQFVAEVIDEVEFVREHGYPKRALNRLLTWIPRLKRRLGDEDTRASRYNFEIAELQVMYCNLLNQRAWVFHHLCSKGNVLPATLKDFQRATILANKIKDNAELVGTKRKVLLMQLANTLSIEAKSLRADGYYIAGKWSDGLENAGDVVERTKKAIGDTTNFGVVTEEMVSRLHDEEIQRLYQMNLFWSLHRSSRALLLCNGHAGIKDVGTEALCLNLLNNGIFNIERARATLWESLGRVKAMQGTQDALKEAEEKFTEAEKECLKSERDKNEELPSYKFQIVRGRLTALRAKKDKADLDYAEELGHEGFKLARRHGHPRYWRQITEIVSELEIADRFSDEIGNPIPEIVTSPAE